MCHDKETASHGQIRFEEDPMRLDAWLARNQAGLSRGRWQKLIRDGLVLVNGDTQKANYTLQPGDQVTWTLLPEPADTPAAEAIPFEVLYEDDDLIAINKPPGLVTHPAPGHPSGTLVNALLHHAPEIAALGGKRPGIVHRLDKDTSGVIIAAKREAARDELVAQFKAHTVKKIYLALAWGTPQPPAGTIETLIGRNPHNRKKMSAEPEHGRKAVSYYHTEEEFTAVSLLSVRIETGRTHQIRVHLSHIGHPVVGDRLYGRARHHKLPVPVGRQMLHAARLELAHPGTGERIELEAPVPADMRELLTALRTV
jgi:23S rRNA pseudouridine1911/1915/1917 synthase